MSTARPQHRAPRGGTGTGTGGCGARKVERGGYVCAVPVCVCGVPPCFPPAPGMFGPRTEGGSARAARPLPPARSGAGAGPGRGGTCAALPPPRSSGRARRAPRRALKGRVRGAQAEGEPRGGAPRGGAVGRPSRPSARIFPRGRGGRGGVREARSIKSPVWQRAVGGGNGPAGRGAADRSLVLNLETVPSLASEIAGGFSKPSHTHTHTHAEKTPKETPRGGGQRRAAKPDKTDAFILAKLVHVHFWPLLNVLLLFCNQLFDIPDLVC